MKLRANGNERVKAIHLRHLQVHQRHVGTMGPELLDRLATVRRFCDQRHIRLNRQRAGDPLAHQLMVVDRENPNRRTGPGHDASPLSCADMVKARQS